MSQKMVRLDQVCEVIAGQSPPSKYYNENGDGLPFYQGKADFGEMYPTTRMWCSKPQKIAEPKDILISVRAPVGPTNLATEKCCIGRGLSAIRATSRVDTMFLLHYLRSIEPQLSGQGRGSTFSAITQKDLRAIQIPLPPLEEQRRIAAILDTADTLRTKRRQAIAKLDTLLQSTFLTMFGDPVTNPMGWEVRPLGEIASRVTKGESPKWQGFSYQDKGVNFVTSENVGWGHILEKNPKFISLDFHAKLSRSQLRDKDLLVNLVGASIGRSCLAHESLLPANVNQAVAVISLKANLASPDFVLEQILTPSVQSRLLNERVENARANISLTNLRDLEIILPPLVKQSIFYRHKASIQGLRVNSESSIAVLDNLFHSIQQRAFRGDL